MRSLRLVPISNRSSVKMYKSRIWKWGLDKKLKSDEVLAILLLKHERDAQRKPTQFTIRGQPVDLDNINRYIKRNPVLVARFRSGQVPSVQTSHEVSCYTPPPSPGRSISAPLETFRVDEMLRLFRDYVEGSFASFAWEWQYDVSCIGRIPGDRSDELFENVMASFALVNRCLKRGDNVSVEKILNPAFESLKEIVAAESPFFVVRTVSLLWYLERHHKRDLLRQVSSYLGNLVPIMLGQHHPLARIWHIFSNSHFSDYEDLSLCLYSMLIPLMEQRIGPANYLTTMLYGDHIDCLYQRGRTMDAYAVAGRYRAKVDASGQRHSWLYELAVTQTALLCANKEADGLYLEAIEHLKSLKGYPLAEDQLAVIDTQLGNYSYKMGDHRGAISAYRRAARLALAVGADERLLTTCLTNLETALNKEGWIYEANRVRDYRVKRIEDFANDASEYAKRPYLPHPCDTRVPFNPTVPYNAGFSTDDSWLWQEATAAPVPVSTEADFVKSMQLAPVDPSMRWMDYPTVTDGWARGEPAAQIGSLAGGYTTMAPLMSDTWHTDVFR